MMTQDELNALVQLLQRFITQMTLAEQQWCQALMSRIQAQVQAQGQEAEGDGGTGIDK